MEGSATSQVSVGRPRTSVAALVAANLMPVYGVLFLHWTVFPLVLFFWMENVVVGVFNVLRMIAAGPADPFKWLGKLFFVPFFTFHYGMFTFVHGIFVVGIFGGAAGRSGAMPRPDALWELVRHNQLHFALLALVLSHGVSFFANYLGRGEYRTASLAELMGAPYGRVVVLHIALLFGGFVVMATKSAVPGLILLIAMKVALDVRAHLREHARLGRQELRQ